MTPPSRGKHCDSVVRRLVGAGTMVGQHDAQVAPTSLCTGEHIAPHNEHEGVRPVKAIAWCVTALHCT